MKDATVRLITIIFCGLRIIEGAICCFRTQIIAGCGRPWALPNPLAEGTLVNGAGSDSTFDGRIFHALALAARRLQPRGGLWAGGFENHGLVVVTDVDRGFVASVESAQLRVVTFAGGALLDVLEARDLQALA